MSDVMTDTGQLRAQISAVFYSRARDGLMTRVQLRDQAINLYLVALSVIATVFGGAMVLFNANETMIVSAAYLLILICVISNAIAHIISQHHMMIGAFEHFLVTEFDPHLRSQSIRIPQWDLSHSIIEVKRKSIKHRYRGNELIIIRSAQLGLITFVVLQVIYGGHYALLQEIAAAAQSGQQALADFLSANATRSLALAAALGSAALGASSVMSAMTVLNSAKRLRKKYAEETERVYTEARRR